MKIWTILFSILLMVGCNKTNLPTPACIEEKFFNDPNIIQVWEYRWNGHTVFLVIPDCCDQYDMVYSLNCEPICAPSGGFTGSGDGKCPDFYTDAEVVEQVFPS
ncbi:MAG: hypothetical protein ACE5D0_05730 [Fidelibacterota bacterium]